ncbi:MAG TPA: DUF58 domain-containing protein [Gemmatales bacterium]|nr:DUF58 domain-containing protein [Gemmatales bacterium]
MRAGHHWSKYHGAGLAFDEVRPYQPGDEVRNIDWNVTARMGQPYIKRYREERELHIIFILDISSSLKTGQAKVSKRDIAAQLLALLSVSGLHFGDSLGLILFGKNIESYLPPRRGLRHAMKLMHQALYQEPKLPGTSIAQALKFANHIIKKRSVVVVLSDFLDQHYETQLGKLTHRHEVYALQVRDPLDMGIPSTGLVNLVDSETGVAMLVDSEEVRIETPVPVRNSKVRWVSVNTWGNPAQQLMLSLAQQRRRPQSR